MHATPASLLDRLRTNHEPAAWERFVELYSPLLFHWAKRLGLQDSDAADLVQDVFLLLYRKLPQFEYDPSRSFHAWLKTVFTNQHRQRLRTRQPVSTDQVDNLPAALADSDLDDRRYVTQQALRLIEREFSPVLWQAFQEFALLGRAVPDIARDLGISPGTVYSAKSKVLNRLRQELKYLVDG